SNASLYEGGSAVCEAVLMAMHSTGRKKVVLAEGLHPEYRQVVATCLTTLGGELVIAPSPNGCLDPGQLADLVCNQTAAVVVQHPNVFGNLEDVSAVSTLAHQHGAVSIQSFDPI